MPSVRAGFTTAFVSLIRQGPGTAFGQGLLTRPSCETFGPVGRTAGSGDPRRTSRRHRSGRKPAHDTPCVLNHAKSRFQPSAA